MIVVRVIQVAGFGMGSPQSNQFLLLITMNRDDPDSTVSLQNNGHDNFICGAPTAFGGALASTCNYIFDIVMK